MTPHLTPRKANPRPYSGSISLSVYPVPKCSPSASDNPLGVCLERGIIIYLPLIAALMAIQPSMLSAAHLSAALPLEKEEGESRFGVLSLDNRLVNPLLKLRDPRSLSMNGR